MPSSVCEPGLLWQLGLWKSVCVCLCVGSAGLVMNGSVNEDLQSPAPHASYSRFTEAFIDPQSCPKAFMYVWHTRIQKGMRSERDFCFVYCWAQRSSLCSAEGGLVSGVKSPRPLLCSTLLYSVLWVGGEDLSKLNIAVPADKLGMVESRIWL